MTELVAVSLFTLFLIGVICFYHSVPFGAGRIPKARGNSQLQDKKRGKIRSVTATASADPSELMLP